MASAKIASAIDVRIDDVEPTLRGAEKKRTLKKHPFGRPILRTTPSPLLWRALTFLKRSFPYFF